MLHKGKLQAALQVKRGQFSLYDGTYSEQLKEYQQEMEQLYKRFVTSDQLEQVLSPNGASNKSAGARPSIEFDRWLVSAEQSSYHGPLFPFGNEFANHEQARQWAECIEGITTVAVDGSQLLPWRDASIPVALVQVGFFINPHAAGQPYTKDVRMEVLAPDDIAEPPRNGDLEADSYPYSDMQVTLRRYLLEIDTLCVQMEQLARARRAGDPLHSPVVFFDGSLVVSFALTMQDTYRKQYIDSAVTLLQVSEELRVPLVGYIDTSYARDMVTMLRRIDAHVNEKPVLRDTHKIHDALLWQGRLRWGDRTPAMICARGDILESYGYYHDKVAFSYLQTSARRPPARLEFPRWMLEAGIVEPVMDVVRAELIAGNGYPYAIETADAVSVITMQDRAEFYTQFQNFIERQGATFTYSTKSVSKGRRR